MDRSEKLQNFVFRGMLLDSTFGVLADSGLEIRGDQANDQKEDDGSIKIEDFPAEIRIGVLNMARVYSKFFCFENSVRKLVSERLLENRGSSWWNHIPEKIKTKVKGRIKEDKKNKWHAPRANSNINYCDFSDLCSIIINNWDNFEDLFPSQEWIKTRLNDLEPSRNAIAHNNALQEQDIKRIDMFLRDWVLQVG